MHKELITHGRQEIKIEQSTSAPDEFSTMNYDDIPTKIHVYLLKHTNNQGDILKASVNDNILLLQQTTMAMN